MNKAVVFLTRFPHIETLAFAEEIAFETEFDVFIITDEIYRNKESIKITDKFKIIHIPDEVCKEANYINCMISDTATNIRKNPIAYDKMLYYFCEKNTIYDRIWVFEDDVFIPSIETITNLDTKYGNADLVVPNNFEKNDNALDWHWKHILPKIDPPYYFSMVCACMLSYKMLDSIKKYVSEKKELFFTEVMFNTLAMHNGLNVVAPLELKSIVWQGEWGIDEFLLLPDNVFHPKKNLEDFLYLRLLISKSKADGYIPKNKLPKFITDLL